MTSIKELKSIDLSSWTINLTGISVLFAILISIVITLAIGMMNFDSIVLAIYIIPTIVVGSFMCGIYYTFTNGFLYNTLAKKLNPIKFTFKGENELVKISTTETAIMTSIIATIQVLLFYLATILLLPLLLNTFVQTLFFSGQQVLAFTLYQYMILLSDPTTIAIIIFGTFIFTFIFVLLGCYIYNAFANTGRGAIINLSKEDNMTAIDSIDIMKFAIAISVVYGILNLILAMISVINGVAIITLIGNIIGGFISGAVNGALIALFYNILAPRIGKIKLELIDK